LFKDLSFSISAGDCFELRGPNGSGKTSLLRILCGLLPPTSGSILWQGKPIGTFRDAYHASVIYVGHRPAVKDELTALENLRFSCAMSGFALSCREAHDVLDQMSLVDQENLLARHLSEGQQRRLDLARLLVCQGALWLLDEALTSLDEVAACSVMTLINEHVSNGGMAIIATHRDLTLTANSSRRIELAA
jgi:heme exporter protein A